MSLTAELWDAIGPLVSTQVEAKDGKPPIEINLAAQLTPWRVSHLDPFDADAPTLPDATEPVFTKPRTFRLAALIRSEVVFVYHEVPCPTATVPLQALEWLRSLGGPHRA